MQVNDIRVCKPLFTLVDHLCAGPYLTLAKVTFLLDASAIRAAPQAPGVFGRSVPLGGRNAVGKIGVSGWLDSVHGPLLS